MHGQIVHVIPLVNVLSDTADILSSDIIFIFLQYQTNVYKTSQKKNKTFSRAWIKIRSLVTTSTVLVFCNIYID